MTKLNLGAGILLAAALASMTTGQEAREVRKPEESPAHKKLREDRATRRNLERKARRKNRK
jgi:hypothetical protein